MTLNAWPDIRSGTGEVVKKNEIFLGKVRKYFGRLSQEYQNLSLHQTQYLTYSHAYFVERVELASLSELRDSIEQGPFVLILALH